MRCGVTPDGRFLQGYGPRSPFFAAMVRALLCLLTLAGLIFGVASTGVQAQIANSYGAPKVSRYTNMDAPGHDLRWQRGIASADQCEGLCLADAACAGYTFNITKNACFLKSSIDQMSASQDPAVTGVVDRKPQQAMAPEPSRQVTNSSRDLEFSTWMSGDDYNKLIHDMAQQRQYPILLEAKVVNNGLMYRAAFDPYPYPVFSYTTLTNGIPSVFAEDDLKSRQKGFVLSYRQSVFLNGQERIQAVWVQGAPSAQANTAADAKPSFDCARASVEAEWAICGSLSLSRLDAQMAQLYWARAAQLQGTGAADDQRRKQSWLLARNACGANLSCLEQSYAQRIAELSGQAPLAMPQPAPVQPLPVQPSPPQQAAAPLIAPPLAQPVQTAVPVPSNDANNPPSSLKRVALVVGNSAYKSVSPLTNPVHDATLIGETLQGLGFELVGGSAQLDLDKAGFDEAVQNFGKQMVGADVGLFYYAGHGIQVRGENYLVPVSANPVREADVDFQMLDMNLVLKQMEGAGTRLNLVLVDACRNNPFGGRGLRAAGGGLARVSAPKGTLISFATDPGNVAQDGEDGDSPYSKALAQAMKKPGLGLFDVFNEVGLSVEKQTGGTQQPWVQHSPIAGSFYFTGAPAGQTQLAMAEPEPLSRSALPAAPAPAPLTRSTSAASQQEVAMIAPPQARTTLEPAPATECDRLAVAHSDQDRPEKAAGIGLGEIDPSLAIPACRAALEQYPHERRLMTNLARAFEAGQQFEDALHFYRQAADAGSAAARNGLAVMYEKGRGVPVDQPEAVRLYRQSADAGNAAALNNLGRMYESGQGVEKDTAKAVQFFRRAADAGYAEAMVTLANMYRHGRGVPKNETEAVKLFRKAADLGNAVAAGNIGLMYDRGEGVAIDHAEAARFYQKAAEAGNIYAMYNLGNSYANGEGVERDLPRARLWYQKAADLGDEGAKKALKSLHAKGR